jgi:thioredoxin-like negative regulator of GroEL
MNRLIIVLSTALLALVIIRYYGAGYEGFEGGSGKSVIICKADWCGHCKTAAPEFKKLMAASPITLKDGSKATVKILDADKDKSEIGKYKVRGFPTILIADGSKITEYPGERTSSAVIEFLNS